MTIRYRSTRSLPGALAASALAASALAASVLAPVAAAGAARAAAHPRPGYITGTARTRCGRPLRSFAVNAYGFDGQPNVFPSGSPPLGSARGHNGTYALRTVDYRSHRPVNALVDSVEGTARLRYQGHTYSVPLAPTDGRANFAGHSGRGIVRNFVLATSGVRPGDGSYRNQQTVGVGSPAESAFYGASVLMFLSLGDVPGQTLTVAFTPLTRTLADGCRARAFTRSITLGPYQGNENFVFQDIPLGYYRLSAMLTGATPRTVMLQLDYNQQPSATVDFRPLPTSEFPDGSGSVNVYAS